jgi:hypothetical protein
LSVKNQFLDHVLLAALAVIAAGLLAIWPVPHTIAIRNILLGIGFLIALFVIWKKRCSFAFKKTLPTVFILILFAWLLIHYFFLSIDPSAQLKELKSTWLRAFMGGGIAFSFAVILPRNTKWRMFVYLGVLAPVIIYLYSYAHALTLSNHTLYFGFTGLGNHKIVLGFVGILFLALVFGIFSYWSDKSQKIFAYQLLCSILLLIGVSAVLVSFVLVNTRNGIAAFLILMILWLSGYLYKSIKSRKYLLPVTVLVLLIPLSGVAIQKHLMLNNHWNTLLADIKVGYQIDKYDHWQSHSKGFPQNELGVVVNVSNYERMAFAIAGLRYLSQNPLGAGILADSFRKMAAKNGIESHSLRFTHSGWIDLSLAVGVPGILLIFSSMLSSVYWAMKRQSELASVTVWLLVAITIFWLIAELATNKHFVEMLIFMLVFLGAVNAYDQSDVDNSDNPRGNLT